MTPSPILKVLSTFQKYRVRTLLIGGQAAILYGGAEFSRDIDFTVAISPQNLRNLAKALKQLQAVQIYFPALNLAALKKGHACHFRCMHKDADHMRVDIIGTMRGVDVFELLWKRRQTIIVPGLGQIAALSIQDLVQSKKTQRDKDWLMIRRLVEADIMKESGSKKTGRARFWLLECRTPILLCNLAKQFPSLCRRLSEQRPLLSAAFSGNIKKVETLLLKEERLERIADIRYWKILRTELERMRLARKMLGAMPRG